MTLNSSNETFLQKNKRRGGGLNPRPLVPCVVNNPTRPRRPSLKEILKKRPQTLLMSHRTRARAHSVNSAKEINVISIKFQNNIDQQKVVT